MADQSTSGITPGILAALNDPAALVYSFGMTSVNSCFPSTVHSISESTSSYILKSAYEYTIPSFSKIKALTDTWIQLTTKTKAMIRTCTDWEYTSRLNIVTGLIEDDYTPNLGITIYNLTNSPVSFPRGAIIAELIFFNIPVNDDDDECVCGSAMLH